MIFRLQKLYPDSFLNPEKKIADQLDNYYLVEIANDQLYISLDVLNPSEMELINLLLDKKTLDYSSNSLWEDLLFNRTIDESLLLETIRIGYLHSGYLEKQDFNVWKQTLMESLDEIVEVIFLNNDLILVVLNNDKWNNKNLDNFLEVILSLDQDFNLYTQGMIGQAVNVNRQTADVYKYEKDLFNSFTKDRRIDGIIMLSNLLIDRISIEFKKTSPELSKVYNYISEKTDTELLIFNLFKNQGNLSQAADALYIHRNTLSYRINQFYEKTGFDLTYFPDLIICYLLID